MPTTAFEGFKSGNTIIPVKDTTARNGVIANTKLIKDTVGWSGKNVWIIRDDSSSFESNGITFTVYRSGNKIDYIDIHGTATGRAAVDITGSAQKMIFETGGYRLENLPSQIAGVNVQCIESDQSLTSIGTFNASTKVLTVSSEKADKPLRIELVVVNGTSANHVKFYPMITKADVLDQTYEPYFGSTAFPRSEQTVLGAKNLIRYNAISLIDSGKYELTDTGIRVYNESAHTYSRVTLTGLKIPKNANLKITCNCTITSGQAQWVFAGKNEGSSSVNIAFSQLTQSGKATLDIPSTGNYDSYELSLLCTRDTSELGDVTYSDLMISFDGGEYAPPAMTNRELTEKKADKDFTVISSVDLDDYKSNGKWRLNGSITHGPGPNYGFCEVLAYGTSIRQFVFADNSTDIYTRIFYNNAWGVWYKITQAVNS